MILVNLQNIVYQHPGGSFVSEYTFDLFLPFDGVIEIVKKNFQKNEISVLRCAASEIEGLLGRPPGLCYSYFVGEGLDIVIYRVVTHPSPINNVG